MVSISRIRRSSSGDCTIKLLYFRWSRYFFTYCSNWRCLYYIGILWRTPFFSSLVQYLLKCYQNCRLWVDFGSKMASAMELQSLFSYSEFPPKFMMGASNIGIPSAKGSLPFLNTFWLRTLGTSGSILGSSFSPRNFKGLMLSMISLPLC